jgi:DNA-3-methyladenine glycosylase II
MHLATPKNLEKASVYLSSHDQILRPVIAAAGPCTMRQHTEYYRALGDSIIGQQLSVKAAATIKKRFRELFGGIFPSPDMILQKSPEGLRTAGLSRAKALYILDLARHIQEKKSTLTPLTA